MAPCFFHDTLRRLVREQQGRAPDPTAIVSDSQSVKTTEAAGVRGFDGGKLIKGRKRQLVVAAMLAIWSNGRPKPLVSRSRLCRGTPIKSVLWFYPAGGSSSARLRG